MTFKIKTDASFINYRNKLTSSKKVILDSKISFLESTGFMGNCKIFSNGIFEFNVNQINDFKIYCIMDSNTNTIIFSSDLNETQRIKNDLQSILNNQSNSNNSNSNNSNNNSSDNNKSNNNTNSNNTIKLELWKDIKLNSLKDNRYAKAYYNQIMSIYKDNDNTELFLLSELEVIYSAQGKDNFENIAGFDFLEINSTKSLTSIKDLQDRIKLTSKIKSIEYLISKSGVSEKSINLILKIKEDLNLKDLNSLKVFFSKSSV